MHTASETGDGGFILSEFKQVVKDLQTANSNCPCYLDAGLYLKNLLCGDLNNINSLNANGTKQLFVALHNLVNLKLCKPAFYELDK